MHIDPGPIPTFTPSTPALAKNLAASAVATLPATTSRSGKDFLTSLIIFRTDLVCACAAVSYTHLRAHETPEHLVCRRRR